jgi:dihydrofolate synthase / folylpolyglutamate synthase
VIEQRYKSATRFISSREFFGMKLGLDNVREFVEHIGNPQDSFPAIHIAGTNGKGSTVTMLGSVLAQSGYKTGVFTSPHLVDFRERITINGRKISKQFVVKFIESHKAEIIARKITYFEVMVSLAISYFAARKVDIAVIETGLGGRLDATNILRPLVCAITEISRDHTRILGETLPAIAKEKGGIIKPTVPLALGVMPKSAEKTLRKIAASRSARILPPVSVRMSQRFHSALGLAGDHQRDNLRLALTVLWRLRKERYSISDENIRRGLGSARWEGRFQIIKAPTGATVVLDVAHNETGVDAFVRTFQQKYPGRRANIVAGFVKQKDHTHALRKLLQIADELILTGMRTRRSADPAELARTAKQLGRQLSPVISVSKTPLTAFRRALRNTTRENVIVIVGSHYLVGEFLSRRTSV